MKADFLRLMNEATRLTRAGDLSGATAAIQNALRGSGDAVQRDDDSDVIEVQAREVPTSEPIGIEPPPPDSDDFSPRPARGSFLAGSHVDAIGRRDYKLYVPPDAGGHPLPLIVMLHGCTQDPDDFAAGTAMNDAALANGFFVLYPAQSQQVNPQRCWNWFKHNHQQRGRGEPALLAGMTREVMIRYAIDADRVFVAGLSAGGAMAAILGDVYRDLYAAVGVHSGLAPGIAHDLQSALAAMNSGATANPPATASGVPTIVFHGDADTRVHPRNAEHVIAASVGNSAAIEVQRERNGGRAWTRRLHHGPDGRVLAEHWLVHGAPHAWSGGRPGGSHTDSRGPDASGEMMRFFLEHPRRVRH
ncbi:MAG: PHB depolymerase family esterase [Burkholderiaceae bacterium]|nr:PHB depolymerase family esterase [Burkholderiaceae bacterium]